VVGLDRDNVSAIDKFNKMFVRNTDSQYKGTNEVAAVFYEIQIDLNNTTILVLKCYIHYV
jgi:hypothetical protein